MPERGFHPGSFIIQHRTAKALNLWGPFADADAASHWAVQHLDSGVGRWLILPLWDPKMVDQT